VYSVPSGVTIWKTFLSLFFLFAFLVTVKCHVFLSSVCICLKCYYKCNVLQFLQGTETAVIVRGMCPEATHFDHKMLNSLRPLPTYACEVMLNDSHLHRRKVSLGYTRGQEWVLPMMDTVPHSPRLKAVLKEGGQIAQLPCLF
jgi:hypothetical protein